MIKLTPAQVNPDALRRLLAKLAEDEEAAFARRAARAAQEQRRKLEELTSREERGAGGPGGGFAGPDGSGQWVRRAPHPAPPLRGVLNEAVYQCCTAFVSSWCWACEQSADM